MSAPFFNTSIPNSADISGQNQYVNTMLLVKTDQLNNAHNSNKRMIEFNESYRKKQSDYNWLVIYVIIAMLIFVILLALKFFIPTIPQIAMDLLYVHVFGILMFIILVKLYFIWSRNNMNYDEINVNVPIPNNGDNSSVQSIYDTSFNLNNVKYYLDLTGEHNIKNINGVNYIYFTGDNGTIKNKQSSSITVDVLMVGKGAEGKVSAPPVAAIGGSGGNVAIGTIKLNQDETYYIHNSGGNTRISNVSDNVICKIDDSSSLAATTTKGNVTSTSANSNVAISAAYFDSSVGYLWTDGTTYARSGDAAKTGTCVANSGYGGDAGKPGCSGVVVFAVSLPSTLSPLLNTSLQQGMDGLAASGRGLF